jgi:hypothetical protein
MRAAQLLLGHRKLEGMVRCLGFQVEDALEFSEQTEVEEMARRGDSLDPPRPARHCEDS